VAGLSRTPGKNVRTSTEMAARNKITKALPNVARSNPSRVEQLPVNTVSCHRSAGAETLQDLAPLLGRRLFLSCVTSVHRKESRRCRMQWKSTEGPSPATEWRTQRTGKMLAKTSCKDRALKACVPKNRTPILQATIQRSTLNTNHNGNPQPRPF
jgi:hypothetical protein